MQNKEIELDGYYCPEIKSRWKSYNKYKLILWFWMMNEITMMFTPAEVSHNGFYVHIAIQAFSVLVIGMPLAYSEICLGQYTNCNLFSFWDFFPLFRNLGYATFFLIYVKTIYLLVLTSWYLIYTFYSALDNPPWHSCVEFNDTRCMVKKINVSIFQHCIEAQLLVEDSCHMETASNFFFSREIGLNSTLGNPHCYRSWKTIIAICVICSLVYILSIKKEKIIQMVVHIIAIYICLVILVLFSVAMSNSGTWYASKISVNWTSYTFHSCFNTVVRGFLSVGTGNGILSYLSRDVSFRSPATMTTISSCLLSFFVSFMFALIAYSGIKTMSYYHGEEENVLEIGTSLFFPIFASISEIMLYFNSRIWAFFWFSSCFITLFLNFWILFLYLQESLLNKCRFAQINPKFSSTLLMLLIILCSLPFQCSDLTGTLTDATEIMQVFNSLLISISLYWIYGIYKHKVDIIFMIGIKANYYWRITWLLNPIFLVCLLYRSKEILQIHEFTGSYIIKSLGISTDSLVLYIVLGIYGLIVFVGIFMQVLKYCFDKRLRDLVYPVHGWGPKDTILYRSRNMFMPEIMTREFLYRQVRIRGYQKRKFTKTASKKTVETISNESSVDETTWSVLTSN